MQVYNKWQEGIKLKLLYVTFFFFIFGPIVDIGIGQLGDVSFYVSVLIILYALFIRKIIIDRVVYYLIAILMAIFLLASINTVFLDPFQLEIGSRALARPVRAIIVVLSAYFLAYIFYEEHHKRFLNSKFFVHCAELIYFCILIHAIVMVSQFVFPEFRNQMYQYTFAKEQLEYNQMFRMAGLTGAGGAQTAFVQGLGGFIGWYLMFRGNKKNVSYLWVGNIIILASIVLCGRSGLIPYAVGLPFFYLLSISRIFNNGISFRPVSIIFVCSFVFFLFNIDYESILGENYAYLDTAYRRTFRTFLNYQATGSFEDETVKALLNMIIVPEDVIHFIFGRTSYLEGNVYYNIMTDIGYFQLLWGYGIIGLLLHVVFYVFMIIICYSKQYSSTVIHSDRFLVVGILSLVIFFNAKEIYFMTRISFHITMLLFFSLLLTGFKLTSNKVFN